MAITNVDIVQALDKIRLNNLYVHNDEIKGIVFSTEKLKKRKVYLVETLAVINALVDRGTMLLYGGHGGGKTTLSKYLGQVFHGFSKDEIEACILRGHPQLTEEKILGSLDIAQLTRAKELNADKKVDVIWNSFVDSPWKIIDELNRLSPYAQNILLSLLAESTVKYHNESRRLPNFSLYATMNPKDEGNFVMSLPFLDRFALALPITMPDYESLATIGKKDKTVKQDDLAGYLHSFDLKNVQDQVRSILYTEEAELFINMIVSAYKMCDRTSKEAEDELNLKKLCKGCHYDAPEKVCNKIIHPLSVRVKEDLYRYGKALAWFLGDNEVSVKHIEVLAPYVIWHRSDLSIEYKKGLTESKYEDGQFTINIKLESTKDIIEKLKNEFEGLKNILKEFDQVKKGKLTSAQFELYVEKLSDESINFLLVKHSENGILKTLLNEYKPIYSQIIEYNSKIDITSTLETLADLKESLSFRYDIPNRQYLAEMIERKRRGIISRNNEDRKFILNFETFYDKAEKNCSELFVLVNQRYRTEFRPAINSEETLSDGSDTDFQLTMKRINSKRGNSTFDLQFKYRGPDNTPILSFLLKQSESKS